jgi:hypothetical protein
MRLIAGLAAAALATATAQAAGVSESQFPPKTVRDLIAICGAAKEDPMMTGAVNYCHGFVEGAVIVEEAHEKQRKARKLFCIPVPLPSHEESLVDFTKWANALDARLDEPAIDGFFLYLAQTYPCAKKS